MKNIQKNMWKEMLRNGFKPQYPVTRTCHGRYYFVADPDWERYEKEMNNKEEK